MRSIKFGLIAALVGSLYLVVPYSAGKSCLGMECLKYTIASIPVVFIGMPWSKLILETPVSNEIRSQTMSRGSVLQKALWPRIGGYIFFYLLNVFVVFGVVHRLFCNIRKKRNHRKASLNGS